MSEVPSTLAFEVQRELEPKSNRFTEREVRVRRKDAQGNIRYSRGYTNLFRDGPRVAFVNKFNEGMHNQIGVDSIVEIDDIFLKEPLVIEQTDGNFAGLTLGYDDLRDAKLRDPQTRLESVMLVEGGGFRGPLQAGFRPGEHAYYSLGQTSDGKQIRLDIYDARPQRAPEVPPVSRA